jgi:hypothetical protein
MILSSHPVINHNGDEMESPRYQSVWPVCFTSGEAMLGNLIRAGTRQLGDSQSDNFKAQPLNISQAHIKDEYQKVRIILAYTFEDKKRSLTAEINMTPVAVHWRSEDCGLEMSAGFQNLEINW